MKTMAIPSKISYNKTNNLIDLTTVEPSDNNKCYLVDKRLLDKLISRVTNGKLDDIKRDIIIQVESSDTKNDLFERLDEYIYLDKVINLLPKEEILSVGEAIDAVANNVSAEEYINKRKSLGY